QEEEGADALVEVLTLAAEGIQVGALAQQLVQAGTPATGVEGGVAHGRLGGGDERAELSRHERGLVRGPGEGCRSQIGVGSRQAASGKSEEDRPTAHGPRRLRWASNSTSCVRTFSRSAPSS